MKTEFGTANWIVLIAYLAALLAVGAYFTRRASKNTDAFFKAEGKIPAWAAGFSMYATTLSAITFMSTPEQAFNNDWAYAIGSLSIMMLTPVFIKFYIPFYRKLKVTTAYEYLEERFNPAMRAISSLLFMIYHIGRVAVVIYLPIIAITSVSSINPILVAVIVGGLCIVYTFLGGIEGVVWSDVIQGFLLLGGALLVCIMGIAALNGSFGEFVGSAAHEGKLLSGQNFQFEHMDKFVPVILLGQLANTLYQYTGSQDVVQRYQVTKSIKETEKALWTNFFLGLITIPIFFGMGTVLWSFYADNLPEILEKNTAGLVPYFVITQLPAGIAGLVIAGIFAAAQSTIASSLNAISSCAVTDFKQRFFANRLKGLSDVALARIIIAISGCFSLAVAIYFLLHDANETWNIFLTVSGLFGVPVAGIFFIGIFTKTANSVGAIAGLIISVLVGVGMKFFLPEGSMFTSALMIAFIAFVSSLVFSYLISLVFPKANKEVTGLTYATIDEDYVRPAA